MENIKINSLPNSQHTLDINLGCEFRSRRYIKIEGYLTNLAKTAVYLEVNLVPITRTLDYVVPSWVGHSGAIPQSRFEVNARWNQLHKMKRDHVTFVRILVLRTVGICQID